MEYETNISLTDIFSKNNKKVVGVIFEMYKNDEKLKNIISRKYDYVKIMYSLQCFLKVNPDRTNAPALGYIALCMSVEDETGTDTTSLSKHKKCK
jgi:hypothetical protein